MGTASEPSVGWSTRLRHDLADVLDGLDPQQWDAATLCRGWAVAHVTAHLTMPFRLTVPGLLARIVRHRGFDAAADADARLTARHCSPADLTALLRTHATNAFLPPGGGPTGALAHDVVHTLDITEALGLDFAPDPAAMAAVAAGMTRIQLRGLGFDPTTATLVATDGDVRVGTGPVRELPLRQLIPVLTGRTLPLPR